MFKSVPLALRISVAVLALAVLVVYGNTLFHSFMGDDYSVIVRNDFVKSWRHLPRLFDQGYFSSYGGLNAGSVQSNGSGELSYRPVVTFSYFLDYAVWKSSPAGYHLSNILLHILNTVLVYVLAGLLLRSNGVALLCALFFAVHPVNGEAVNVVAFREDLLAAFFFFSALIFHIRRKGSPRWSARFYGLSLVSFFLALFSKEMAVVFPLVAGAYDYFVLPAEEKKSFLKRSALVYLGYACVLAVYGLVRFGLMKGNAEVTAVDLGGTFLSSALAIANIVRVYVSWLVMPLSIRTVVALHPDPAFMVQSLVDPRAVASVVLVAGILLGVWLLRKRQKVLSFSIAYFMITLLPVSNIVPLVNYVALRYLYLPSLGFCLALAVLVSHAGGKDTSEKTIKIRRYLSVLILGFYAVISVSRNSIWKDNDAFALELYHTYHNKDVVMDYFNPLGRIIQYKEAVRKNPRSAQAHTLLGIAYGRKGLLAQSVECFEKAIELDPGYFEAYKNMGTSYARMRKWDAAIQAWQKALALVPQDSTVLEDLREAEKRSR